MRLLVRTDCINPLFRMDIQFFVESLENFFRRAATERYCRIERSFLSFGLIGEIESVVAAHLEQGNLDKA